ncbi:MAG: signal recognition particle subunit SRP19/SEC65 family protein [Nitrososphaeraceae archaeon]|jgi:signal recognition particle subunit SRP19|nr:signal recognition particle subunit SRP19/SEC65 family protein [Nitrososphaeraceae archaeon]MDW0137990.1 signal recognition particle subunit SRP19/SEC65 family protein [Nitrososphaeraceae archaeon]MDW0138935.1 signal recognition particle subunit SRP19/SEC65 family protein [Nitrososphaeraceae archaeon]MDW0142116.1 signal recognition particle subunit SRP19/SEC65 family protein [Nitrososphaeraceae archaeon]MDW0144895.1 signal recognition particle subunit SRP19/SEC65 family protein [Nitrososphae
MKDYDHQIVWLDYFNKNLSRKKGRKVSKNISVYDPTMQELIGASKTLELDFSEEDINNQARYPRRAFVKSGYIMISKRDKKSSVINQIAKEMIEARQQKH